jgi:heat shock protein HslJ
MRLLLTLTPLLLAISVCACSSGKSKGDGAPPPHQSTRIEDVTWQLVDVQGKGAQPVPAGATAPNLRLSAADKRFSGFSGVNQFSGGYQLEGQSLKFGAVAMTRRAGKPEYMQQEAAFSLALMNTASWRATSKAHIELLNAAGRPLASFAAQNLQ